MDVGKRLAHELDRARERLRQRAVVVEEAPGGPGERVGGADPVDEIQRSIERDIGFATRSLLIERTQRLAEALDRLREGQYGICEECGEPIAPARLAALPEVTTCVRCQDRLERAARLSRTGESAGAGVDLPDED